MKGFIFTEFLDLVEDKFGLEMVDKIITQSKLESGGIYTSIGTYDFSEMLRLISNLSSNTDIPIDDLLLVYSKHLFVVLLRSHPHLIEHYKDPMEFLASVENHIHVEVQKIYPDAELPTFEMLERREDKMTMIYKSDRALYMLGKGLMQETFELFKVDGSIEVEKLNEAGTEVKFTIERH
ncbi:MAG: heme NO-binding domain-containing protein [Bacteroidia bacterium]|nr:heme NO-binding domain-containing protein [Bacteroidia bacterium]NND24786.1 heme NO-binding domain-containing protein [Flavobacteriaceae bacterium]NNM35663.1 heme NO-binding domain-containing protein [Nitrosopumilus sp.]MBT8279177.1 heme NO-binding domain-containing protein [Bacteroidia bacterium]NNK60865.1 heme NO-binding domain-containing protein [Flavobacteriaceae bacterium]